MSYFVYRYEHSFDNKGCYNTEIDDDIVQALKVKLRVEHNNSEHPPIYDDVIGKFSFNTMLCACGSIKQLKQWFKGFNKIIIKTGFNLVQYEVDDIVRCYSNLQCAFRINEVINKKILK